MNVVIAEAAKPSLVPRGNVFRFVEGNSWEVSKGPNKRVLTTFHSDLQRFGEGLRNGYMTDQRWSLAALVIHDSGKLAFVYIHPDLPDSTPNKRRKVPVFAQLLKRDVFQPDPKGKYKTIKFREDIANQLLEGTNLYAKNVAGEYNYVTVNNPHGSRYSRESYCQPGVVFFNLRTIFIPDAVWRLDRWIQQTTAEQMYQGLEAGKSSKYAEILQSERDQLTARLVRHPKTLLHVKFI